MNESTTKILTRKKVQNNPELRDQLIDLGNIDPFKSKSKITRSPPKESNIYENLPEPSNKSTTHKTDILHLGVPIIHSISIIQQTIKRKIILK